MADKLPGARAALVDDAGVTTPQFYRYFQALERLQAGTASAADITAINAEIAALQAQISALPESSFPTLQVAAPLTSSGLLQNGFAKLGITVANSVVVNGVALQLDGDALSPGNTYLYSTGPTGTKGWNALGGMLAGTAGNIAKTVNADGTVTFDLAPVTDSGTGTFKLITRDSFGRVSGTKSGTTSDVPEGSRLYFTAARVLATALAGLSTATNAVITAADTTLSAFGKLQAQISANVAAIAGKLSKSANLSDVASAPTALANLGGILQGYIDGLQMQWVSATAVTVSSGTAYIPGLGTYLQSNAAIALSGLALSASTWYHLYLYSNAGTPAVECVTTAPVLYYGNAYQKTGDNTRRYIGSVLTDASGNIYQFQTTPVGCTLELIWNVNPVTFPFRVLSGGVSTVPVTVGASALVPVAGLVAALYVVAVLAMGANENSFYGIGENINSADAFPALDGSTYGRPISASTSGQLYFFPPSWVPISGTSVQYVLGNTSATTNLSIDTRGIRLFR